MCKESKEKSRIGDILSLEVEISPCNQECLHCYARRNVASSEFMPLKTIRRVFDMFSGNGARKTYLDIGYMVHEPTLHPNLDDILGWLQTKFPGESKHIVTNGCWADSDEQIEKMSKIFEKRCIRSIQLTLCGIDTTHDEFVNNIGAFTCLIRATELAHEHDIRVFWNVVLHKGNIEEIRKIDSLSKEMEVERSYWKTPCPIGAAKLIESLRPDLDDIAKYRDIISPFPLSEREIMEGRKFDILPSDSMGASSNLFTEPTFFVTKDLDVYPFFEDITQEFLLGNLEKEGADAIIRKYEANGTVGLALKSSMKFDNLKAICGNQHGTKVYSSRGDLYQAWFNRYCLQEKILYSGAIDKSKI